MARNNSSSISPKSINPQPINPQPVDFTINTREMTTAEAGALGGQRTAQLIEEGKLYEQEHANSRSDSATRKR